MEKNNLIKGAQYKIEHFPENEIINGIYLGADKMTGFPLSHFFVDKEEDRYIVVDDHFMFVNEQRVITHHPYSSKPIWVFPKKSLEENSELIKILNELEK